MALDTNSFKLTMIAATLRGTKLFGGLSPADLEQISRIAQTRSLAHEEFLFRRSEPSEGFFVVQNGSINLHLLSPQGREQVIRVFRPGETFAEATLTQPALYPADARAVGETTVVLIPRVPFLDILARRPDLSLSIIATMATHLRGLVNLVEDLTLKDVETRFLSWVIRRCPDGENGGTTVDLGTKRVLAAELGTSSETLSRTLARLREDGIVVVDGPLLKVSRVDGLRARFDRLLGVS